MSTLNESTVVKNKLFVAAVSDGRYVDVVDINQKPHYQVFNTTSGKCNLIPANEKMGKVETLAQANQLGLEYEELTEKEEKYLKKLCNKFAKMSGRGKDVTMKCLDFAMNRIREKNWFNQEEGSQEHILGILQMVKEQFNEIQKQQESVDAEERV